MLKHNLRSRSTLILIFGLSLLSLGVMAQADDNQRDQGVNHYHYENGEWHGYDNVVVSNIEIGSVVDALPTQNTVISVKNKLYYYDSYRYYSRLPDGSYVVVTAPR